MQALVPLVKPLSLCPLFAFQNYVGQKLQHVPLADVDEEALSAIPDISRLTVLAAQVRFVAYDRFFLHHWL